MIIGSFLFVLSVFTGSVGPAEPSSESPYNECRAKSDKINPDDPRFKTVGLKSNFTRLLVYKIQTDCTPQDPYVYPDGFISDGRIIYDVSDSGVKVTINDKILHKFAQSCIIPGLEQEAKFCERRRIHDDQIRTYGYLPNNHSVFVKAGNKLSVLFEPKISVIDIGSEPTPHGTGGSVFLLMQEDTHTFYFVFFDI
jgi:hypothetical protein